MVSYKMIFMQSSSSSSPTIIDIIIIIIMESSPFGSSWVLERSGIDDEPIGWKLSRLTLVSHKMIYMQSSKIVLLPRTFATGFVINFYYFLTILVCIMEAIDVFEERPSPRV